MKNLHFRILLLLTIVFCSISLAAADVGKIVAAAYDVSDGRPYKGVRVSASAPNIYGRHPTSADGKVKFNDVPAGTWSVTAICPSKTIAGREILKIEVSVRPEQTTTLEIALPNGFCKEPEYSVRPMTIAGHFMHGFELNRMSPCNPGALDLTKNTWGEPRIWVVLPAESSAEIDPDVTHYIEARGTLKGPGRFGHFGMSAYEFEIDEILSHEVVAETDCSQVE